MAMNEWQSMAMQLLPEMQSDVLRAETPMALWAELVHAFDEAYEQPKNDDFIKRVYRYADWCLTHDVGETAEQHLPTCVAICFWEHLVTNEAARKDMPRWITWDDVMANKHFFISHLSDGEFADLKRIYAEATSSGPPAA
jgi:hypothetical protein